LSKKERNPVTIKTIKTIVKKNNYYGENNRIKISYNLPDIQVSIGGNYAEIPEQIEIDKI